MNNEIITNIYKSVTNAEIKSIEVLVKTALEEGIPVKVILNEGLISAMDFIGNKFAKREIFLPDVLLSAKAMKLGIEILKPFLADEKIAPLEKVVIGTVQGDMHDIGKNLVGIMLQGAGFQVIDLGNDVSPERFVDSAIAENAPIIGLSALLTTTMPSMKKVIDILQERNIKNIKVIIGGAPVSDEFARQIGADAHSYDAANAVATVKNLLKIP
jgi:5-methyltetrahydrofolate--homocysteine methyltransferase